MPIGSVEGLLITLFVVVPGGLGAALRRSVFASQAPTAFTELLHALAGSLVALAFTEALFMIVDPSPDGFGDSLLGPASRAEVFPGGIDWKPYFAYVGLALLLPTTGAWVRRLPRARWLFRAASPHADGLDYVMHEARPTEHRREEVWATVNTVTGEALLGQIAWRSTAPDPLELVLSRVRDMNDPQESEQQEDWVVWIPEESIQAVWVHIPPPDE